MIERIIRAVVKAYRDYDGLDEIKRGILLAMEVSGLDYTENDYNYIFDEVLYRLDG